MAQATKPVDLEWSLSHLFQKVEGEGCGGDTKGSGERRRKKEVKRDCIRDQAYGPRVVLSPFVRVLAG